MTNKYCGDSKMVQYLITDTDTPTPTPTANSSAQHNRVSRRRDAHERTPLGAESAQSASACRDALEGGCCSETRARQLAHSRALHTEH